ncbi:hypothetical protein [Sphingomonas xanthus]|uniref:Uncharacterized protein n=1 Tax=Sphingomonas xanthus TaxID=2594473 RepID=A0A516ITL4_9SPHN|nr:hypothetical protein [Sphingomonas xanthus]QDP20235.1 hypothetical protein FMM02_09890 [Sphingomonas xanthus]
MTNAEIGGKPRFWNGWRVMGWGMVAALLVTPAIAMRFTQEVDWSPADFVVMGGLMVSIGLMIEFLVRQSGNLAYRLASVIAALTIFLTIWVNLAVGMIGEEGGYNLLFLALMVLAVAGAIAVSFRPRSLVWIATGVGLLQLLAGAVGLPTDPRGAMLSMMFALPWMLAAGLYRHAAGSPGR